MLDNFSIDLTKIKAGSILDIGVLQLFKNNIDNVIQLNGKYYFVKHQTLHTEGEQLLINEFNILSILNIETNFFYVGNYVILLQPYYKMKKLRVDSHNSVMNRIMIFKRICEQTKIIHSRGVTHCDLKPNNILCSDDYGVVKIVDFGISRVRGKAFSSDTYATIRWCAPEQFLNKDIGFHSDIYSLGLILYYLMTGRVPFDGDDQKIVREKKLKGIILLYIIVLQG